MFTPVCTYVDRVWSAEVLQYQCIVYRASKHHSSASPHDCFSKCWIARKVGKAVGKHSCKIPERDLERAITRRGLTLFASEFLHWFSRRISRGCQASERFKMAVQYVYIWHSHRKSTMRYSVCPIPRNSAFISASQLSSGILHVCLPRVDPDTIISGHVSTSRP